MCGEGVERKRERGTRSGRCRFRGRGAKQKENKILRHTLLKRGPLFFFFARGKTPRRVARRVVSSGKAGRNKARRAHTSLKLLCVVSDLTLSSEGKSAGSFLFGLGPEASVSREGEPMAGGGAAGDAGSAPTVGGGLHCSKRRPRCRIGLWALVATALSLASCKASRPASARVGLGAGLPLGGSRDKGGAWAAAGQLRGGALGGGKGRSGSGSSRQQDKHAQRETLYDAYNMLHTLAQVRTNFTCRLRLFFFLSFFF